MDVFCTVCIIALFAVLRVPAAFFHAIPSRKDSKRGDLDHQQYSQRIPRVAAELRAASEQPDGRRFPVGPPTPRRSRRRASSAYSPGETKAWRSQKCGSSPERRAGSAASGRKRRSSAATKSRRPLATVNALDDLVGTHGDSILALPLDVTDRDAVFEAVAQAHRHFGRLDVILCNAGYGYMGAIEEAVTAEAEANFDTNVFGTLSVIQAALPLLRAQRSGHILTVSSIGGVIGFPDGRDLRGDQIRGGGNDRGPRGRSRRASASR